MMELKDFTLLMSKAAIAINYTLTEQLLISWYELFFDEDLKDFTAALRKVIKEPGRKFFPTPGEVSGALEILRTGEKQTAAEAWDKLITYAGRSLEEHQVAELEKDNPLLLNAMRQIEYRKIRYCDLEKDIPFLKALFIKAFNAKQTERADIERLAITQNETKLLENLGLAKRLSA